MFENFGNFFKKMVKPETVEDVESKDAAKERLQLVLMQDRANVSADFLELMKQEIIDVIKKYIEVDENAIDVRLTTQVNSDGTNGAPLLYANIPIVNIKNEAKSEKNKTTEVLSEKKIEKEDEISFKDRTVLLDENALKELNGELNCNIKENKTKEININEHLEENNKAVEEVSNEKDKTIEEISDKKEEAKNTNLEESSNLKAESENSIEDKSNIIETIVEESIKEIDGTKLEEKNNENIEDVKSEKEVKDNETTIEQVKDENSLETDNLLKDIEELEYDDEDDDDDDDVTFDDLLKAAEEAELAESEEDSKAKEKVKKEKTSKTEKEKKKNKKK